MHGHTPCAERQRSTISPARFEIADLFRTHGDTYRQAHRLSEEQWSAMRAIESCRTAILGGHLDVCDACGFERPAYNSCRNRHCPKCQSLAQARWIKQRMQRILPTRYFHVVFTLPAALRPLALGNRRILFTLLFQAAAQTLLTLGHDSKRLGGRLGITAVLHTWTRALQFHPHLHCVVTGGALSANGHHWIATKTPHYLFPVRVLSALFRAKFLHALRAAFAHGKLRFGPTLAALAEPQAFGHFIDTLYRRDWVVYAKQPFGGSQQVFRYLGRYTHRVAISNQRLENVDHSGVRFRTRHGKTVTLQPTEFIRRFLLHILPAGFVKIRHYGLFAPSNAAVLEKARAILAEHSESLAAASATAPDWREQLAELTGVDLWRCPRCDGGTMIRRALPQLGLPVPDV